MAMAAVMMGAQVAMSALSTRAKNKALSAEQRERTATGNRKAQELARQQERANLVAQEEKSDLAKEMDLQLGELFAAVGEGGRTVASVGREAGAVGATYGSDFARVEGNRMEGHEARKAANVSIIEETKAAGAATRRQQRSNTLAFFGNAVSSVGGYMSGTGKGVGARPDTVSSNRYVGGGYYPGHTGGPM